MLIDKAIAWLEKQKNLPKTPSVQKEEDQIIEFILEVLSEYKYCPTCGQKIERDDTSWKKVDQELPPEDVIVQTKIDDVDGCRDKRLLCMHKERWVIPGTGMYIYYTPTHWRYSEKK